MLCISFVPELFVIELINVPLVSQAFTVEQLKKVPGEAIVDKAQQMHRLDASTLCSLNSNIKVESKQCLDHTKDNMLVFPKAPSSVVLKCSSVMNNHKRFDHNFLFPCHNYSN